MTATYEYRVRQVREGAGTAAIEKLCNTMAKEGWRLASTSATTVTPPYDVFVWLFFERETATAG